MTSKNLSKINPYISIFCLLVSSYAGLKAGEINLQIEDSSGASVPARVLLRGADGDCYYPDDAVLLEIGPDVWFMSDGQSEIEIPDGQAEMRIERGKEYMRIKELILIPEDSILTKKIILKRWINMKARGYLSGENHLHRSHEDIAALCAAEDLNFGSVLQWWDGPQFDVEDTGTNVRNLSFGGQIIPTTVYDVELENDWGAFYLINNPTPYPLPHNSEMPNLIAAQFGRKHGTINCYQAGWSREVLIDALLGLVDVVNVCNNNFHMHRYQPRSRYSNLLEVEGLPIYPDTPEGMMQLNMDTYYRLLNCGVKLAAGAGSATGVKQVPVGYNRAYVRCAPDGEINEYLSGLKKGQNFVTNGPMIFFRSADGLQPGDSLHFSEKGQKITFDVEVLSDSPLKSVEIIINGIIIQRFNLKENQTSMTSRVTVDLRESYWIAARCIDQDTLLTDDELAKYKSPAGKLNQDPSRLRFAHTSPIYIYCGDKYIKVEQSVSEGLKIIESFEAFAAENSDPRFKQILIEAVEKAKHILKSK